MFFWMAFISTSDKKDMDMEKQVANFLFIFFRCSSMCKILNSIRFMEIKLKLNRLFFHVYIFLSDTEMKTTQKNQLNRTYHRIKYKQNPSKDLGIMRYWKCNISWKVLSPAKMK